MVRRKEFSSSDVKKLEGLLMEIRGSLTAFCMGEMYKNFTLMITKDNKKLGNFIYYLRLTKNDEPGKYEMIDSEEFRDGNTYFEIQSQILEFVRPNDYKRYSFYSEKIYTEEDGKIVGSEIIHNHGVSKDLDYTDDYVKRCM